MIDVGHAYRPRIEVDAAEIDDPRQAGPVAAHHFVGDAIAREADSGGAHPVWARRWCALLIEGVTLGAVGEALEVHGSIAHTTQNAVGDAQVIVDYVKFCLAQG